jgi:glycosyltransferase involved in cell wall biosynthesis
MEGGGGEEVFVRDLASHPPRGVVYTLALRHHESVPGARARRVVETAFNQLVQPWLWPLSGLRAYRVENERFDLVHVHNHIHHISSKRRLPVVMSLGGGSYYHYVLDYLGWPKPRVDALYARARAVLRPLRLTNEFVTWQRLSGIFVRSAFSRSFLLAQGVPGNLVEVIPPGFDTPPLPARPEGPRPFRFLFVGRDPQRKGADVAIAAVRRLRAKGLDLTLMLVGDPSLRTLRPADGFEVHAWSSRERLYSEFYPAADCLLLPSRVEGFGLAPIEAMSFALPVIATRYGAFPETIDEGRTGLLVAPGDVDALAAAMEGLCRDVPAAQAMGAAGRRRFLAEYTRERFSERLGAFYRRALGE